MLAIVTMYIAFLVEKQKRKFDIHTYKEIIAFSEGESLEESSKASEEGKRKYQKLLFFIIFSILTLLVSAIIMYFINRLL